MKVLVVYWVFHMCVFVYSMIMSNLISWFENEMVFSHLVLLVVVD